MKIAFLLLFISFLDCCQPQENDWIKQHMDDYKNVIKNFYTLLYDEHISNQKLSNVYWDASLDSDMLQKIKPYLKKLTGELPKENLFKIIDNANVFDEGLQFSVYIELSFSEVNTIYFGLSSDIPTIIEYIWLNDGSLLGSKLLNESPTQKLLLVGSINDKDGYTNILLTPKKNSKIIGKFTKDEIFYYTPISNSEWYPVYKEEGGKQIGYSHKSKILKYTEFSSKLKAQVKKQRGGC